MNANKVDVWMPLYVADYLADTTRLTTEQHGAYLLLLMDYWRNGPLPDNDVILAQITRMTPDAWSNARSILQAFFKHCDGKWIHGRVEAEMSRASDNRQKLSTRAKAAAEARWDRRKNSSNAPSNAPSNAQAMLEECPSPSPSPSHKKQKSKTIARQVALPCPPNVDGQVWADFLRHRKAKRAEVTETALRGIEREARIAGITLQAALEVCCQRGWTGFKADWMRNNAAAQPSAVSSRQGRVDNYAAQAAAARGDHGRHDAIDAECTRIT